SVAISMDVQGRRLVVGKNGNLSVFDRGVIERDAPPVASAIFGPDGHDVLASTARGLTRCPDEVPSARFVPVEGMPPSLPQPGSLVAWDRDASRVALGTPLPNRPGLAVSAWSTIDGKRLTQTTYRVQA